MLQEALAASRGDGAEEVGDALNMECIGAARQVEELGTQHFRWFPSIRWDF